MTRRILILGCNGFIGHHLVERILTTTDWCIAGLDVRNDRITQRKGLRGIAFDPRLIVSLVMQKWQRETNMQRKEEAIRRHKRQSV